MNTLLEYFSASQATMQIDTGLHTYIRIIFQPSKICLYFKKK